MRAVYKTLQQSIATIRAPLTFEDGGIASEQLLHYSATLGVLRVRYTTRHTLLKPWSPLGRRLQRV